ncbi:PhzF family phenazine biosynthesis protein [Endozoicomonadaceae bacterium StTr2]
MPLEIDIVDAFTDKLFSGNPAAVVITPEWLADDLMQSIATENNLAATAFVCEQKDNQYAIRWFAPTGEKDVCGHATLAAAFILFSRNPELEHITFSTVSAGDLFITKENDGLIGMSFSVQQPEAVSDIPEALLQGLSIPPAAILRNRQAWFAVYNDETHIHDIQLNMPALIGLEPGSLVITAPSKSEPFDFVSRYFRLRLDDIEDPVTGSIHAGLVPFWSEKLGKQTLTAFQASSRGGTLYCDMEKNRVKISGKAVHYSSGRIFI